MNSTLKRYLVSALTTFSATFLTVLGAQVSMGAFSNGSVTWAIFASVIMVAVRAATKAAIETMTPVTGDPVNTTQPTA